MYAPPVSLATVALLFLIPVTTSASDEGILANDEDKLRHQLTEVDNINLVRNVSKILNWKGLFQRSAIRFKRDCDEVFHSGETKSGLYIIEPEHSRKLVVQCYMDGCNGWTVIQHNTYDTEITWSETWTTYKYGFGNLEGVHWLGTEYISLITHQKWYKCRINLIDADNNHRYAEYDSFVVENEKNNYVLRLGTYEGNAGDSMSNSKLKNMHDNMKFSCKDRDNDRTTLQNCADTQGGGWWYDSCHNAQLNRKGGPHWSTLCDENCRESRMLLKPIHMYCSRV